MALIFIAALALATVVGANTDLGTDAWPGGAPIVIPKPAVIEPAGETPFVLDEATSIVLKNKAPVSSLDRAIGAIRTATSVEPATKAGGGVISLTLDPAIGKGMPSWQADEAYRLTVAPDGKSLEIAARAPHGLFNGIQTLVQLAHKAGDDVWRVPPVRIEDYPRFQWRGYLIDPARHFRPKTELLRTIDLLALHKLNVLHLHLTDDQGWRIEIKKYPKLTTVGSEMPDYGGESGPGRFYSQADVKEIVAYAAERFVTVVPEIEMPGHSGATTTAYPELSCDGKTASELCVTKPAVVRFATDVLGEVAALFPSNYIHIGGDEVQPQHWRACPSCHKRMDELTSKPPTGIESFRVEVANGAGRPFNEDAGRLQGEFIRLIDLHLAKKGKRMIGWDEVLDGGLAKGSKAVIAAWRSPNAVFGAGSQGRDVVVSLYPDLYLDNPTSLSQTYAFEPCPSDLPEASQAHVLGVQGNMWGESTATEADVDRRTFPRLLAIAEVAWSLKASRDYNDFIARLTPYSFRLRAYGIMFGIPISR